MADFYILDTHTLLWYLEGDKRLGKTAAQILGDQGARFWLPIIALAEALFVLEKGRSAYTLTDDLLLARVRADLRIRIFALSHQVLMRTLQCKAIDEMHDRQIVATALLIKSRGYDVAILTRDENITATALVPVLW